MGFSRDSWLLSSYRKYTDPILFQCERSYNPPIVLRQPFLSITVVNATMINIEAAKLDK
jgi:hypothetical protein